MKNNQISTYEFDPDKKDHIHKTAMDKLLKEIKANLTRNKKIKVVVSEDV